MLTSTLRIRIEWSNCDPAGIIFNPHYFTKIGNTSFETSHTFHRVESDNVGSDNSTGVLLCSGSEVRVWGGTDDNSKLVALRVPDRIRDNLSVDKIIDSSV